MSKICNVMDCYRDAVDVFTVGARPAGVDDLTGWPVGAPPLRPRLLVEGSTVAMCSPHSEALREAVANARPLLPLILGTTRRDGHPC